MTTPVPALHSTGQGIIEAIAITPMAANDQVST
jgi:hypothetical protein